MYYTKHNIISLIVNVILRYRALPVTYLSRLINLGEYYYSEEKSFVQK